MGPQIKWQIVLRYRRNPDQSTVFSYQQKPCGIPLVLFISCVTSFVFVVYSLRKKIILNFFSVDTTLQEQNCYKLTSWDFLRNIIFCLFSSLAIIINTNSVPCYDAVLKKKNILKYFMHKKNVAKLLGMIVCKDLGNSFLKTNSVKLPKKVFVCSTLQCQGNWVWKKVSLSFHILKSSSKRDSVVRSFAHFSTPFFRWSYL